MKYSYNWLQKHIEEKLPEPKELQEVIVFHAFEVESLTQFGTKSNEDWILDIKVLPDRAGDCLSHYGMAREIAGLLKLTLKNGQTPLLPEIPLALPVEIKTDVCKRYIAIAIDGVKVGPSPDWLKNALVSVGQRSINNIVDATNYVLQDLGQPVHAFDAKKIDGGITVRNAHEGETIITLGREDLPALPDGREQAGKKLSADTVVIADYVGAMAIAGVKGGKTDEVDDHTTSVLIEVANFDAASVRKTARVLNLQTDASKRFENNLSSEVAKGAAEQVAALIIQIAGGEVVGVKDIYPQPQPTRNISFTISDITRVLGQSIDETDINDVFDRYSYTYTKEKDVYTLTIPFWRADITGAHDIAEEIGRVVGYDSISALPLPFVSPITPNEVFEKIRSIKKYLSELGFSEVMNYTFVPKGDIEVAYGAKGKSALRTNLSDGLKESYEKNRLNAASLKLSKIKVFEIGTVFFLENEKIKEEIRVAVADDGAIQEVALDDYVKANNIPTETIPYVSFLKSQPFKPWSIYPPIVRDISVWIEGEERSKLTEILDIFAIKYDAPWHFFDEFSKDGRTSLGFRFVFQAKDRTLTDAEVAVWWETLLTQIKAEKSFEIR